MGYMTFYVVASASTRAGAPAVTGRIFVALPPVTELSAREGQAFIWTRAAGFTRITPPQGASKVFPRAINDAGQVVGSVELDGQASSRRAFVWSASSGFTYLNPPDFRGRSIANAINASGTVTGETAGFQSGFHAFVWSPESGMTILPAYAKEDYSSGKSINSAGQIAGIASVAFGVERAFRWSSVGGLQVLPVDTVRSSFAVAINNSGQVVGSDGPSEWYGDLSGPMPVLWDAVGGRTQVAGCDRPCEMQVVALNDRAQVAGNHDGRAFRWSVSEGINRIPEMNGFGASRATAMNDGGDMVGVSGKRYVENRGWLWTGGGELIDLGMPPGVVYVKPAGINNAGQVVGTFR